MKLSVTVSGKGKLSATAKAGAKVVGKASKTVKQAGTAALKIKVSRKGRLVGQGHLEADRRPAGHQDRHRQGQVAPQVDCGGGSVAARPPPHAVHSFRAGRSLVRSVLTRPVANLSSSRTVYWNAIVTRGSSYQRTSWR